MTDPIAEWFSSLLPRVRRALQDTMRSPKAVIAGLLVVGGVVALALTPQDTADTNRNTRLVASMDQLTGTTMVAALDTPLDPEKNTIWCASAPVAWKLLKETVGGNIEIEDAPLWAEALNRSTVSATDIDPAALVTGVGLIGDGVVEATQSRVKETFGNGRDPWLDEFVRPLSSDVWIVYGYLAKRLEFPEPFDPLPGGIYIYSPDDEDAAAEESDADDAIVDDRFFAQAFGLRIFDAENPRHRRIAKHVRVHGYESPENFVVVLECKGAKGDVILARGTPERTFQATLGSALAKLALAPERLTQDDCLSIPVFDFHVSHSFPEIVGKRMLNAKFKAAPIVRMMQSVLFRLNENGADLRSRMGVAVKSAERRVPKMLILAPPFLILLKQPCTDTPFFAMWVANREVLVRLPESH